VTRPDIVVTGLGAVSALGLDTASSWRALAEGRHGITKVDRYPTDDLSVHVAAMVPWDRDVEPGWTLGELYAVRAAREAFEDARLSEVNRARIAIVVGTMGELRGDVGASADRVAEALDVRGPRITISTACTSSANAIGLARDLVLAGWCDAAIAGGTDELEKALLAGFAALGVLSDGPCAPFSTPVGTTLGEGAAFVVLERAGRTRAIASLLGYGMSSDAHHETTPHPQGAGVARAMRSAILDAGIEASSVAYVNAHGTGTDHNDVAEWRAVEDVFGRGSTPAISATKSQLGHAQGAAGALELVATLLARREGMLLPTLRFTEPRPRGPIDPVAGDRPRPARFDRAISASSAFGGANCSIAIGDAAPRELTRRSVFWLGHAAAEPSLAELRKVAPHVDPRGLDPSMIALIAAAGLAIEDAGARIRGDARDRAGIVLGATRISRASLFAYQASIAQRGYGHVDTNAFARVIPHAPAARCSMALSLRGPATTVHAGAASGLVAIAHAAELLSTRGDVETIVASGVDEVHVPELGPSGAACALLSSAPAPRAIRIAGWAIAGDVDEAIERAGRGDVAFGAHTIETSPALTSMSFALDAARAVRDGARRALAFARGRGASAAILLAED
jgi:3-oxoacyl-[acyl-carrier-protein] synthase II